MDMHVGFEVVVAGIFSGYEVWVIPCWFLTINDGIVVICGFIWLVCSMCDGLH